MKRSSFVLLAAALTCPAVGAAQQPAQQPPPQPTRAPAPPAAPGWLGVTYDLRWIERAGQCEARVVVEGVLPGSPAERAGLRIGDAIVAIDGDAAPAARLPLLPMQLFAGDSVRLRVARSGAERELTAVADRRPDRPPPSALERRVVVQTPRGPTVRIYGDTLVASGFGLLPDGRTAVRGYWLAESDGRTGYRVLPARPQNDLDRRVSNLLHCALPARAASAPAAAHGGMERIQQRADSLRVVMARRALESAAEERRVFAGSRTPEAATGTVIFRLDDGLSPSLRAVAGAEVTGLEPELAEYFRGARAGVLVLRVGPGTPAARAGLRPGDVIVASRRGEIASPGDLRAAMGAGAEPVELAVVRQGRRRTITLPRP